jgi:disulfide bond formation protein DsbB
LFAAAVVLPVAAVCIALFTQHVLGMQPCPWCVLQRLIFAGISLAALLGLLVAGLPLLRRLMALAMFGLAGCGVAAALWQHIVATTSPSCNLTLADRIVGGLGIDALWPQVFAAYTSCADAAATLLGVPYEFYSLTLFVVLGAAAVAVLGRRAE